MPADRIYGCIEAGGTKFVLGVLDEARTILRRAVIPTRTPAETFPAMHDFFAVAQREIGTFEAFGIASFGPAIVDPHDPAWGTIASTPKPGWSNVSMTEGLAAQFGRPIGFDTDVNGAALAEGLWGAGAGTEVCVYITVGTGIGGGILVSGKPVHGVRHPEIGHIQVRRHADDEGFAGSCPFHGDCLEGLASGSAVAARGEGKLGDPGSDAGPIAYYLGQLVIAALGTYSPGKIVMGGGVMKAPGLFDAVRTTAETLSNGYFALPEGGWNALIVPPAFGDDAGLVGALGLALSASKPTVGAGRVAGSELAS